jgi:hypothetical protein
VFHSVASVNASQRGGSITKENLARPGSSARMNPDHSGFPTGSDF